MAGKQDLELLVLRQHQVELLSALETRNVKEFSDDLYSFGLITDQMGRDFTTLDVDARLDERRQLRLRYLLQLVHFKVRQNKCKFHAFLNLLKNTSKLRSLCERLKTNLEFLSTVERGAVDQVQHIDKCISEEDIPDLVEQLTPIADKWEEIALGLRIPHHRRADIRKSGKASIMQLEDVLHEWVTGMSAATLNELKKVLAGKIVNRPKLAVDIATVEPTSKTGCLDDDYQGVRDLTLSYTSIAMNVSYGKSTLLEVHVNSATNLVSCQWFKNGHELSDGDSYRGTKSSILLVRHRDMASKHIEGKYVCQVESIINSDEIPVEVHYPDRIRFLIDSYRKLEEVPKDSWPPKHTKSFVELALIDRSSNNVGEYDYSVRRDMDDIIKKKKKIDYYDAFGRYRSGELVLVEGRPGCGKSTLAHKVTSDWSRGEKVLVGAELVFLIPLRILNFTQKDRDIFELIEHIYLLDTRSVGKHIMSNQGSKTCFIFDGLDEYQRKDKNLNTFVEELLRGKLSNAMVIVFTRPIGSFQLKKKRSRIHDHIEILGFKKDQIHDYIDSYFGTSKMAQGLKEFLDQHINVLHMCYLPVHASMICYLYSHEKDKLPTTETQFYTQFTTSTISRKLMREDTHLKEVCLEDLGERNKDQLFEICKLAFEMTSSSEQVFCRSKDSVQLIDELGSDGPSLGLVTVDCGAKSQGYKDFYSFLHLTFQEYLAAYYINQLEIEKQLELLRDYKNYESMLVVWKFYCGLIGINPDSALQDKIQIITSSRHADSLYRVHCAFESQHSLSCDAVLNNSELSIEKTIFRLFDYNAISYVISKSSEPLGLKFYACTFDENGISHLLAKTADSRWESVKELLVHNKNDIRAVSLYQCFTEKNKISSSVGLL